MLAGIFRLHPDFNRGAVRIKRRADDRNRARNWILFAGSRDCGFIAHIPQPEAALLKVGDKAPTTAPGEQNPIAGTVTIVRPALDPNSTTVAGRLDATDP